MSCCFGLIIIIRSASGVLIITKAAAHVLVLLDGCRTGQTEVYGARLRRVSCPPFEKAAEQRLRLAKLSHTTTTTTTAPPRAPPRPAALAARLQPARRMLGGPCHPKTHRRIRLCVPFCPPYSSSGAPGSQLRRMRSVRTPPRTESSKTFSRRPRHGRPCLRGTH